ncbi:MAG: type III secretion T3S chaperone [Oceanospirillaceae bacterium]|nr:type III secretion T3S chaperone [Oceanospirillaceae bacterium]
MDQLYPLAKVLEIKKRRVDEAERNVAQKKELLRKEEELLKEKEAERDKAKQHHDDKLQQLRDELDEGTTTDKVEQMKVYLKICKERVVTEEQKVKEQQEQVDLAQKNVEIAEQELRKRRMEVDKLKEHRVEWIKEYKAELAFEEQKEQDEMGELMFMLRKRRGF